jgi:hypothetical protein
MEERPAHQDYTARVELVGMELGRALARLDVLASGTHALADELAPDQLAALQYALHEAGELLYGIEPPPAMATAHADLTTALARARELTGEVAEVVEEDGAESARLLVPEWRGTLFAVRLAQMRLVSSEQPPKETGAEPAPHEYSQARHLMALAFLAAGTGAFTAGATVGAWPLWTGGLAAVCGSMLVYRH